MIEVGDRPVLSHVAENLLQQNMGNIIVNVHYKYDQIMEYFGNTFLYQYEPELLGTAGSIRIAGPWLVSGFEDFLVLNGDTISNLDVNAMYQMHTRQKYLVSSLVDPKTKQNAGAYMFSWKILEYIPFRGMIDDVLREIPHSEYIQADLEWIDIGTPEGLKKAREVYGKKN